MPDRNPYRRHHRNMQRLCGSAKPFLMLVRPSGQGILPCGIMKQMKERSEQTTMSLSRDPNHIRRYQETRDQYPVLHKAAEVLERPPADIIGRDIGELRRGLRNPEKANIALLAEPGTGKTAYVQGFAYDKDSLPYYLVLNVNPERLIDKAADRDNALLTGFGQLLEEARRYGQEQDVIVILFIDEFHKLADISPNLLESIKPKLEKSAMNGFRLVAATTFEEYNKKIAGNRALDQRFLKIKLSELPKDAVISILENRAKQHEVLDLLEDGVLDEVYVQSKRILIDNAQPRASIDVLNSMIGDTVKKEYMKDGTLHKEYYAPKELGLASEKVICRPLLKRIIQRTHGIDIDNEVEVTEVITALKTRLYDQDLAIETIVAHLEMAAQGFGELDRPKISFLSTGSTGTGKTQLAKIISESMRIPLKRFDMSRYSADIDAGAFADALFQAAWATPNAYILIDEVEKSSKKAMNILLQVLDDARLTDSVNPDRVASFSGCIINLTTNLGSEIYQNMARHQGAGATTDFELVYKALSNSDVFETAVLGRLDAVVPFQPLQVEALEKIARQTLSDIIEGKETDKRRIIVSPDVIPYIIKDRTSTDTERGGARDAKRNVKNLVAQKLAHYLTYANREVPVIIYIEGEPRFKNRDVADPMNAQVALKECHPINLVDALLAQLSQKVGKPLLNKGLYLPADVKLALYGQDIVKLALNGYNKFKSEIDGERVYVVGV